MVWAGFGVVWKGLGSVWEGFGAVWEGFEAVRKGFGAVWYGFAGPGRAGGSGGGRHRAPQGPPGLSGLAGQGLARGLLEALQAPKSDQEGPVAWYSARCDGPNCTRRLGHPLCTG